MSPILKREKVISHIEEYWWIDLLTFAGMTSLVGSVVWSIYKLDIYFSLNSTFIYLFILPISIAALIILIIGIYLKGVTYYCRRLMYEDSRAHPFGKVSELINKYAAKSDVNREKI